MGLWGRLDEPPGLCRFHGHSAMGAKVACGISCSRNLSTSALASRERLGLLRVPLICGCERPESEHADPHNWVAAIGESKAPFEHPPGLHDVP